MYMIAIKDKRSGEWRVPSHFVDQCGQLQGVAYQEVSALLGCAYDRELRPWARNPARPE